MAGLTVLFRFLYMGFLRDRQGRLTETDKCDTENNGRSDSFCALSFRSIISTLSQPCLHFSAGGLLLP